MKSKINEIVATLNFRAAVCLDRIDPNTLVKEMIKSGQESIIMKGYLIDRFADEILIYSDDDIKSLIISYLELEKIKDNTVYAHGEYLNSGLFGFTAKRDETGVNMNIEYCPGLNVANLVEKKMYLSAEEYLWWWRSIASSIYTIADSLGLVEFQ